MPVPGGPQAPLCGRPTLHFADAPTTRNRPGTPTTTFRLDPDLLAAARVRAAERGETLTGVVRRALHEYVEEDALDVEYVSAATLAASAAAIRQSVPESPYEPVFEDES